MHIGGGVLGNWSVRGDVPLGFGHVHVVSFAPAGTGVALGGPELAPAAVVDVAVDVATLAFFLPLLRVRKKKRPNRSTTTPPMSRYRRRFWDILAGLARQDDTPWPADIPEALGTPGWEFCFRGEPIFVVCNTPAISFARAGARPP